MEAGNFTSNPYNGCSENHSRMMIDNQVLVSSESVGTSHLKNHICFSHVILPGCSMTIAMIYINVAEPKMRTSTKK